MLVLEDQHGTPEAPATSADSDQEAQVSETIDLAHVARRVRASVVRMAHEGKTPHVGSALSCTDLLVALYFSAMKNDPAEPTAPQRDRFILSKGHGCTAHYAALAEHGYFPRSVLSEYAQDGGRLAEHPSHPVRVCPDVLPGLDGPFDENDRAGAGGCARVEGARLRSLHHGCAAKRLSK